MFEAIYSGAETGGARPPWDYGAPRPQLVEWVEAHGLAGGGREALVVGCGYGADAELLQRLGFRTTAFDFAPTAIAGARRQHPASEVTYLVADVLDLPGEWEKRFDLVVESLTVQSMPPAQHASAARSIAALVAPGGTLLVLATTREDGADVEGPPWPLTRAEVEGFADGGLVLRQLERIENGAWWRAELTRDAAGPTGPSRGSRDDLALRLSAVLERAAEASGAPGAQAAVVRNGELVWAGSYGVADLETARPVDDRTIFCLASVGKTLLAALALHLVERRVLMLDEPLATVVGDGVPGARIVTLRMLLSHTGGYPDLYETPHVQALMPPNPGAATGAAYDPDRPFTWEMLLPGILEPVDPGEHWAYSNTGYIVLTEVLTRVLGGAQGLDEAWRSFVGAAGDRRELTPDLLTFDRSAVLLSELAHGYLRQDDGSLVDAYATTPASGVPADLFGLPFGDGLFAGTATGVAVFLDALFVRHRLLQRETIGWMTATTAAAAAAADAPHPDLNTYGMGTFRMDAGPGGVWQGHRGSYAGFGAIAASHLESNSTLAVLTNSLAEPMPVERLWDELVFELGSAPAPRSASGS